MTAFQKIFFPKCASIFRSFCSGGGGGGGSASAGGARKGLILGAYRSDCDEAKLTNTGERFNERSGGKLMEMLKDTQEVTNHDSKTFIFNNLDPEFASIAVVDLGKENAGYNDLEAIDEGRENVRSGVGDGISKLFHEGIEHVMVEDCCYSQQAAEGAALSAWRYQDNKDEKYWKIVPSLEPFETEDADGWTRGIIYAEAQNIVRKLCSMPANLLTPSAFAQAAIDLVCPCSVTVEVRDLQWLQLHRFESILTAAKGSCEPPLLLEFKYCGAEPSERPILMVGKGTTFDSGGLFLRRGPFYKDFHVAEHRADMAGAALCIATVRAAALMQLPINIIAVCPMLENLPSGMAMKSGDVVTSINGKTIAIHSPDMEGRLAMADTLTYSIQIHNPKLVLTIGTMTEGVVSVLGSGCGGVFSNSRTMWKQLHKAGAITGDRLWKLPLFKYFLHKVTKIFKEVDVSNKGHGKGEPCLCAAFLSEFIPCVDWVHVDTMGVGMLVKTPLKPYMRMHSMSGRPTRTIAQFLYQIACPIDDIQSPP